jgi:hypothetical protein
MKKRRLVPLGVATAGCIFVAMAWWAFAQHGKPEPLRIPTREELQRAFPHDVDAVLENAKRFVLYSTSPTPSGVEKERFHGYGVLGKMTVADPAPKKQLLAALYDGIAEAQRPTKEGFRHTAAGCFNPRHGIRALSQDGKVVDLLICFSCRNAKAYAGEDETGFGITKTPQAFFNRMLRANGIPIAP